MEHEMMEHSEILLYSDENGKEFVNVVFMDETFWLTQVGMAAVSYTHLTLPTIA